MNKLDWVVLDQAGHLHEADTIFGLFKVYKHPDHRSLLVAHFGENAYQCKSIKQGKQMMQAVYDKLTHYADAGESVYGTA